MSTATVIALEQPTSLVRGPQQMNKTSALEAFRRFWWIALLFALIGGVLGALPEPATRADTVTSYQANFSLLITSDDVNGVYSNTLVNQIKTFATRGEVPKRAAISLGQSETSGPSLAAQVVVVVDTASLEVNIATTQATAKWSEDLVNAFGDELVTYLAELQDDTNNKRLAKLDLRADKLKEELVDLQDQLLRKPNDAVLLAQLDSASRQYSSVTEQYANISANTSTITLAPLERGTAIEVTQSAGLSAPKSRTTRGLLGFIVGLAIGCAVAIVLSRLDRRIRSRSHSESIFGGAVSSSIPDVTGSNTGLEVSPERHDQLSDSYRTLRSVITFSQASLPAKAGAHVTLVVSACSGDGKTSIAANLAAALVETGKRVVAVNADFRRPTLVKRLIDPPPAPLAYTLEDLTTVPVRYLLQRTPVANLVLLDLATVKASPGNLARATARVLPEISTLADAIVIDSSPIGVTAEVLDLLPLADTVVVVMRLDHTLASAAQRTMEMLRTLSDATFLLALVGDSTDRSPYYEYGHRAPRRAPKVGAGQG
jgi:Mrp family chromosome partitioning ATPase/capsular polysaccharide biosynthesis protein